MLRPIIVFSLLSAVVNAQFADFISRVMGVASQKPLVSEEMVIGSRSRHITSENWKSIVEVPKGQEAKPEDTQEWLFYFTGVNSTATRRNITFWDGVYKDTIKTVALLKSASNVHFGSVNCTSADASELCNTFFLADPYLPVFYHLASYYVNGSTEIRKVPWNGNVTEEQQSGYIAKFLTEKQWKGVHPWNSMLNPIDGQLKQITPYLGLALKYYDMVPQWAFMIIISVVGRQVSNRMVGRMAPQPQGPLPTAPAARN